MLKKVADLPQCGRSPITHSDTNSSDANNGSGTNKSVEHNSNGVNKSASPNGDEPRAGNNICVKAEIFDGSGCSKECYPTFICLSYDEANMKMHLLEKEMEFLRFKLQLESQNAVVAVVADHTKPEVPCETIKELMVDYDRGNIAGSANTISTYMAKMFTVRDNIPNRRKYTHSVES
ncbi:uncharacterized protein LOC118735094 [Rhagoletis pomonella]|uniref:uncharacterized protein LOC118735094 n=1 Tax=Rhagoletis pomonella TaxID=28610 RepID=UPI0017833F69|nr:uncharacterized protein LOC118735094 [Rhagoletis pomonella]